MPSSRRSQSVNAKPTMPGTLGDVEQVANLIMMEARTSLPKAFRIIGKMFVVWVLGFVLASNCCLSQYLVPIGILALAISAGWLDAIGHECKCHRFFPYERLNSVGQWLFRWQWVVFWAVVIYALSLTGLVESLQFSFQERLWRVCAMAVVPLMLMLLCRALEPFRFRRARSQLQKAEILVRQLAATNKASDISALAPLVQAEQVPLYNLGSIAKLLHDFAACQSVADKLKVDLTDTSASAGKTSIKQLLSMLYAPFGTVAEDLLLWESRDLVIYAVVAVYMALAYIGSYYFPWSPMTPMCVMLPFLGPKSRAARYVRALQENIRLAQGAQAEKKGGMTPDATAQESSPVVNWPMAVYLCSTHLTALYALMVLVMFGGACPIFGNGASVQLTTLILAAVLYVCSALGITAGVHRLWTHKSYKAAWPLRVLLMIFNSIANQGSIFHWARDHRVHHLYSDTAADPHDASRGFWFSHVGWLLFKKNPQVIEAGKKINMNDLYNDPIVMFQKHADPFWNLMWCFGIPAFVSLLLGDTFWNGFLIAGALRYIAVLNATWAVNSVVHAWGNKPYNPSHLTTENGWVSLFAIGEGWHNWHHAFSWDYAAAELGAWSQFNPTKVFIDVMAFLGLAWDRKRAHGVWAERKARWEAQQGRAVMESLEGPPLFKHRVVTFGPAPYDSDSDDETCGVPEQCARATQDECVNESKQ